MRYEICDIADIQNAILEMSTRHPEIDSHIEGVLTLKKKCIDLTTMRRLKDLVMLYCGREWKHAPKVAFVAYCMKEFYKTDNMFDEEVKRHVAIFWKENNSPEQLELL